MIKLIKASMPDWEKEFEIEDELVEELRKHICESCLKGQGYYIDVEEIFRMNRDKILVFVNTLKNTHPDFGIFFTMGHCFDLFRLIRAIEPSAVPYYAINPGHVYTKVGNFWYDINGKYDKCPNDGREMTKENWPKHSPHRWPKFVGGEYFYKIDVRKTSQEKVRHK